MAYSELRVINMALQRLGVKVITSADWTAGATGTGTVQANAAYAVWEEIRNEVLEAADWRFAKTRVALSKVAPRVDINCGGNKILSVIADKWIEDTTEITIEIYSNSSDALSVVEDSGDSDNIIIKLANATGTNNTAALIQTAIRALSTVNGVSVASWTVEGNTEYDAAPPTADVDLDKVYMAAGPFESYVYAYTMPSDFLKIAHEDANDPAVDHTIGYSSIFDDNGMMVVHNNLYHYAVETLLDKTKVLLTDYNDSQAYPLELVYIRLETDPTKWTAHFISAVAYRLAAELCYQLTEGKQKFSDMFTLYESALMRARGHNQAMGHVEGETGSKLVEYAGR